jgi:hypothetical protein
MRVNFITVIRQWLGREDGGALAELAIIVPFLAVMLAGVSEFGRYFQNYTALSKATRNASRYLSNHNLTDAELARAKNLVICGKLTCGKDDRATVSGLTAANVCLESTKESKESAKVLTVTVRIPRVAGNCDATLGTSGATPLVYKPIFNVGALLDNPSLSLALPLAPGTTMYYMID